MIYIESKSFDPHFNLAMEQFVFDDMDRSEGYFLLWQNANTIVVGKNQNTIAEINQKFVDEHHVNVVRRLSGGGAVYHDLGNLNFTVIVSKQNNMGDFDFARFCLLIVGALKRLGVKAEINGRNDITINGKKFSGNSQYIKQGRIMHHGCLLYNSDLSMVAQSLKVSKDKIASKGIKSVASRVTNIVDCMPQKLPLQAFKDAIVEELMAKEKNVKRHEFTPEELVAIKKIQKERYDTWEWNYGRSPKYDIVKERYIDGCGKFEIHMNVKDGIIEQFDIFGDYFGNGDKADIIKILTGVKINRESVSKALADVDLEKYFHNMPKDTFVDIIVS
jgi:lipoate-protein ligase A